MPPPAPPLGYLNKGIALLEFRITVQAGKPMTVKGIAARRGNSPGRGRFGLSCLTLQQAKGRPSTGPPPTAGDQAVFALRLSRDHTRMNASPVSPDANMAQLTGCASAGSVEGDREIFPALVVYFFHAPPSSTSPPLAGLTMR